MKIAISYPPIVNDHGQKAMVSQNRNVEFFKEPTYLLPVTYAQAATDLKEMGYEVYWDDGNAQLKSFDKWLEDLVNENPNIVVFESTTPVMKFYWQTVDKVKKAIANKNPVVIGMQVSSSFYKAKGAWNGIHIGTPGGHAMVVVGYDDTKYGGAFEIMNSWGTNWGNNGFIWVKYDDFKAQTKTAYVLIDKEGTPNNINDNNLNSNNIIAGEITLKLGNGQNMNPILSNEAKRNFNIVKASKSTYKIDKTYSSGTQFRIYLNSKQRGYVYLIGYGSSDKSVNKLYPFENFSDFFNYTNSEIAIPSEDYFIEFDNNPGRDILCVLYSKEKLDINNIISKAKNDSGDFVSRIKSSLQDKMFNGDNVKFNSNKIAFNASSKNSSNKVVPIFIEMNHQ